MTRELVIASIVVFLGIQFGCVAFDRLEAHVNQEVSEFRNNVIENSEY